MQKCSRYQVSMDALTVQRAKIAGSGNVSLGLRIMAERASACTCKAAQKERFMPDPGDGFEAMLAGALDK